MATKNDSLFSKTQFSVKNNDNPQKQQYSNLNLNNQTFKSLDVSSFSSQSTYSKSSNNDKHFAAAFEVTNSTVNQKHEKPLHLKKKQSLTDLCSTKTYYPKAEVKKHGKHSSNSNKNSTLSLHITAYENSIEAQSNNGNVDLFGENRSSKVEEELTKTWKKQFFIDSTTIAIQNYFEIPRQQKSKNSKPEVMQFKASQKLFNPNQSYASKAAPIPLRDVFKELEDLQRFTHDNNGESTQNKDDVGRGGGWSVEDMFRTNQNLGVQSTFKDDLTQYTTVPVEGSKDDRARAAKIAKEIEANEKSKRMAYLENDDEERDLDKETIIPDEIYDSSSNQAYHQQKRHSSRDNSNKSSFQPLQRNAVIVPENRLLIPTITKMTDQQKKLEVEGRRRIQKIFSKLDMFKDSIIHLDDFIAEYETSYNVQLATDLQTYFGSSNFFYVFGNFLTDLATFHYKFDGIGRPKLMLEACHDFRVTSSPPSKMVFRVIEYCKEPDQAPKKSKQLSSRKQLRPLLPGQEYTTATVDGIFTSDEEEL